MNYCPSQPVVQAGKLPEYGQWVPYVVDSGDVYPGIIWWVGETSPDGKYVNVSMVWGKIPRNGHPGGFVYGGWLYEVATGRAVYVPCGPPWP